MFTERDEFSGSITLTQTELADRWFADRVDDERLLENPTLAKHFEAHDDFDVTHEAAREQNRPIHADRVWIDGLLEEYFNEDDDEEMLDLVDVRAPEEVDMSLDDLVLTDDQENELDKISKAIEHRDYLSAIGLREIGKLLFVGPPGTGKTSTAQALAQDMDLPFVEVKLSMITSQYLARRPKTSIRRSRSQSDSRRVSSLSTSSTSSPRHVAATNTPRSNVRSTPCSKPSITFRLSTTRCC